MPSEDKFHEERPETNRWLEETGASGSIAPTSPAFSRAITSAKDSSATKQAAQVQRIARALGRDAEELAKKIPEDTLRRLKYPLLEHKDETGRLMFKHDVGVVRDGRQALTATDRAHGGIEKGSSGRGAGTPQPRSGDGRFTK
jgi:hypothetical protein